MSERRIMDKCKGCLMLMKVRKLKVEIISFLDSEEIPAYCRACYQDERAKNKAKDEALDKLARLGNEPFLGNSDGNIIAQEALKEHHE